MQLWRGAFLVLPMIAAAWAAGCSDDDPAVTPAPADGGTDAPVVAQPQPPSDAGTDAPSGPCADQIDADGLAKVLSCTGLYSDIKAKTVAADAVAYKPAVEFWSDAAEKSRWLHIPAGQKIDTSDMNEWVFPDGTKVWKEFKLGGKRIETRIFAKNGGFWNQTSYLWNADESEATRIPAGQKIGRTDDAGGGANGDAGVYEIPNQTACLDCHVGKKDSLLGVDAVSLGLPGATGITLASLIKDKKLTVDPAKTDLAYPASTPATGGDKAAAALGWLHANCGQCHNDLAGAGAAQTAAKLQIKATELLPVDGGPVTVEQTRLYKTIVCQKSFRDETAGVPFLYVRSGEPARSLVHILAGRRVGPGGGTNEQMPPVATHIVDEKGLKLVTDWITALTPACP